MDNTQSLLAEHLETLAMLPQEICKNMMAIRQLDIECRKFACEVDAKLKESVKSGRKLSKNAVIALHNEIEASLSEISRLSNEKIDLASESYELIDKHICRLDSDSAKFQASMLQKQTGEKATVKTRVGRKRKTSVGRKGRKRLRDESTSSKASTSAYQQFMKAPPVVEMPVDPNEPTYCICHQVSYGEMVMCDNKQCPVEWFHFQCVGLTEPPKGRWYCERCTELRKKKNK